MNSAIDIVHINGEGVQHRGPPAVKDAGIAWQRRKQQVLKDRLLYLHQQFSNASSEGVPPVLP